MSQLSYPDSHHASESMLPPVYPRLEGQHRFDVCVIGAGYTGLSAALHLAELGFNVALVEAQRVGWGASGRSGGQLGYGMTVLQPELIHRFGQDIARAFWDVSVESVELFHSLCAQHGIDCDFSAGNMGCATTQNELDDLTRHADVVAGYGHDVYERFGADATREISGSPIYIGAILAHRAGHINPLKYALGLASAAESAGVSIFEGSRVTAIQPADPATVRFDTGAITAKYVVVGCNGYLQTLSKTLANRILPVDNYQAATEVLDEATRNKLIKGGVCAWDTSNSVHYFRLTPDNRLVMGCSIGIPGRPPGNLEKDCRRHINYVYPDLGDISLEYIWGGTLAGTRSRLPDVGRLADNVLYAQGYTGHGVGLAPLAGKYLAHAIGSASAGFEFLSSIDHKNMPGGRFLRIPFIIVYRLMTNTRDMVARRLTRS